MSTVYRAPRQANNQRPHRAIFGREATAPLHFRRTSKCLPLGQSSATIAWWRFCGATQGGNDMANYQVSVLERPAGWEPSSPDDAPRVAARPLEVLHECESLFAAVREAIAYNKAEARTRDHRWAVVVEPGALGQMWRNARLCTPLAYKVAGVWWPDGWEPQSPLDVPNCAWRTQGEVTDQRLTYPQAQAMIQGLNQQSLDRLSPIWYVIVAVENEPISQTVSYDPAGTETTVQVRRLHVVRPDRGGHGDCSHCPAASFPCAREDWITLEQTALSTQTKPIA